MYKPETCNKSFFLPKLIMIWEKSIKNGNSLPVSSPFYLFLFSIRSLYNINDALKTILSIVARITKANKAWQLSRPGGTYWDNWALSPIIFGRCHDPITIRRGRGALCVEMVLYADISWESRCNIEINVWAHFHKILLVFEVPYQPWVKGMPGKR